MLVSFLHKRTQLSPFDLESTAPLSAILQTGDICRIFRELQHSLARLQHRYCDVTVLIG